MSNDATDLILEGSRFWFQKVLVPLLVVIGVTGNTITVMVLTRKRMRSSTNIYLSALGIADIIYLIFVFLLSFKHYQNIHARKYELYWRFYGISHWLCDAASSTSVWLTVSFTIERYIAVCHPIKGKFFCTENRAKTVTAIVYIFCLLTTASTSFEYQITLNDTVVCGKCQTDALTNRTAPTNTTTTATTALSDQTDQTYPDPGVLEALKKIAVNCTSHPPHIIVVYLRKDEPLPDGAVLKEPPSTDSVVLNVTGDVNDTSAGSCCNNTRYIDVESTELGKNQRYGTFMSWYSALVWGIVPVVLIATFNCFLVRAVYVSQKKRRTMTRSNTQTSQTDSSSMSNENRITIMLIAVVVMFLICQTPTACYLIYNNFSPPPRNIQNILGNVFNTLLAVNASCNFVLYSLMSKRFRSTFREILFNRNAKKGAPDLMQLSSMKSNSQKFNPYYHGINRNHSEYRTPRNLETASLTSAPRSKSLIVRPLGKARSTDLVV